MESVIYYTVTGYCRDCTFADTNGCNEGQPYKIGNFTKKEYAIDDGNEFVGTFPYYFEIETEEVAIIDYANILFKK
jgi:hypothetical protein